MAKSEVLLSRSSEWSSWYEKFVSRAQTAKIFKYVDIDEDGPTLVEPQEPITADARLEQLNATAHSAWESTGRVDAAPEPATDLTEQEWTKHGRQWNEFKARMAAFATYQRAYADLAVWIQSTVDEHYYANASSKSDIRTIVRDLKSSLAPTSAEEKELARLKYRHVLTQTKRVKPEDWLVAWNKAKLDGEKHKIPEIDGESGINDFLTAVSAFDATWATQQRTQIMNRRKLDGKTDVTLRLLSELFQEQLRSTQLTSKLNDDIFAISNGAVHDGNCPCGLPSSRHRWKAADCAAVQIVVNGASKDGRQVNPRRIKTCEEALKQAKWKSLIDKVKGATSKENRSSDKTAGNTNKPAAFVGLTINAEDLSKGDSVFATLREKHPLFNSTILDGGASTHLVNNKELLTDIREAEETDYVMVGEGSLKVMARGTRIMENILDSENGKNTRDLKLTNVAYVPHFHTNIISADKLEEKGLWHHGYDHTLRIGTPHDNQVLCRLSKQYGLKIVEYKPLSSSYFQLPQSPISVFNAFPSLFSSFQAESLQPQRRRFAPSRDPPPPRTATPELWHLRAFHAGPDALEQLVLKTQGVRIKGPTTVQCTACGTGKATEIISRRESSNKSRQPFYRVFIDIFSFPTAYNGHHYVLLATDEFSGMMFHWSLTSKTEVSQILKDFEARIKRHTGLSICKFKTDNERSIINLPFQKDSEFQIWAKEQGIDIELPPSHTHEPTGGAERPGGINQTRMRCAYGHLPIELWPEIYRAAVWIHNILPSRRNEWMTPKEKMDRWFYQHFRWYRPPNVDFDAMKDHRPDWHGIYAYGCKAYPLMNSFKAKEDKNLFKLRPRAHVGYLVGYHASNIYRIWVPKLNRVILSRDVRFNEEEFFDPNKESQLETEPIMEYRPTPTAMEPLPQTNWDTILDEFLYEFDDYILGIDPTDGSNSGVGTTGGVTLNAATAAIQPPVQNSRLLTPPGQPFLPTPDPTPQLNRRDASTAGSSPSGSNQSASPLLSDSSSTAQRSEADPDSDGNEFHDAEPPSPGGNTSHDKELSVPSDSDDARFREPSVQSTIVVNPLPPPRPMVQQPSSSGPQQQQQTPADQDGSRHRRRTQKEMYGDKPTRRSERTPKPKQNHDDYINSIFTTLLLTQEYPEGNHTTFHSVFLAATSKAARDHRFHRDDLVKLPKRYQDLDNHSMGPEFKEAIRKELHELLKRGTWRLIERDKASAPPLPLKWVFNYKFDQDGYLQRCKARICVRGDLQDDDGSVETYAATLAARTFRIAMATAARFDLDIRQFDVSNAFLYSDLKKDQPVYVQLPKGYVELGFLKNGENSAMIAELDKALYGLRESPLLWYNELSQALKEAGIDRTDEEPCVFTNGKILVLVYVDDILILSPRQEKLAVDDLVKQLQSKYEMREDEFKWYLGIRVVRDRPNRKIYLCQDAYIEKIARKFKLTDSRLRVPSIPIPVIPLVKYDGQASKEEIKDFQERVGSLMYIAVMTRPDIARAAAQLARFLTNPSPEHRAAADQCIRYLYATRFLAIVYEGMHSGEALVIASDASFADDVETRRSSQGYVMMLFNGPVVWKAGLQDTVTTSTTEAELLSLEKTTKESYALDRLLRDISLDLGPLKIYCDNLQSIRLVVEENQRITTKLRHVDIQNMWLKQEFRKGRFLVEYLKTDQMPADGLTKALSRSKFEHFRSMLNLTDIKREVDLEG